MVSMPVEDRDNTHRCGRCANNPWGIQSNVPCPNDRERIEQERLVRVALWRDRLAGKDQS